ncbi:MAG: hypothetical protein KC645_17965, partial [Gemmatimonadetes bacterium]|nr:hypothetical protein [Gemmatimonadota bacterium]
RALEHASAPDRGRRPGRIRPPPRRRAAVLRSGAALLVLAVAALGGRNMLGRGAADQGAPTRIRVFPLVSSLASQGGASVGEDVATVIGHALDGVEPLQWLDGWPLLDAEARNDPRRLELGRMAELARSRGCSFFVWGRVIQQGDSARVLLGLHGVRDGDAIASADAGAALGDAWRAGLRALNGLLPRLIETEVPDVEADLGNRPPEAVARFLLGEAALRRAKFSDALTHFREAFAFDSTFGVAGIRGAQAASWIHDPAAASALIDRALTLPLTGRAESFARGVQAYVANDAEAAVRHLEAALAEDSLFSVAWAQLGETYRHLAPRTVPSSAPGPFERAQGLDSLAGYVLFHRLEELTRAGDLERARRARQQFVDGSPDAALQAQIDLMIGCADGGAATLDPGPRLREWPWEVLYAAAQLGMDGDQRACSEVLYHALLVGDTVADPNAGYRSWNALVGLTGSFLVGNRVEDAGRLLEAMADGFESVQALLDASAAGASGVTLAAAAPAWSKGRPAWRAAREAELTRWSELAVLVGALYPQLESIGRRGADDIAAAAGPDLTGIDYRTSLWLLGFWASRNEDGATAERALERLREIAAGQDPLDQAYTSSLADALAAHITLSTGDSTAALEQFRALTAQAPPSFLYWELLAPLSVERLVRARLELEAGEPEVADRLLRGFAEPNAQTNPVFLPLALERCRVAAGGDARRAECARTLERLGWPGRGPAGTDTSIAPS